MAGIQVATGELMRHNRFTEEDIKIREQVIADLIKEKTELKVKVDCFEHEIDRLNFLLNQSRRVNEAWKREARKEFLRRKVSFYCGPLYQTAPVVADMRAT